MKRTFTYCIVLIVCTLLSGYAFAQPQARGFGNAAPAAASTSAGRTVALVVGVSDYPFVTPLNYAAEDALLMYDFLQSKAGGSVPKENIRLLINEEATSQNVWTRGLLWIKSSFMPNRSDRVIIYLAGHGDADDYNSYFLCHNANPAGDKGNYNWTDVLNIEALKKYIAGFSATGAEVLLIMDACRSGDIPGARTGITNPFESVVERRAGETLMLSASANQLAVEDRRWGRGHGAFTWNLIQGLSGKADENGDGDIDFYEIEQYTKAKVRKETQAMGRMQVPQFAASPSGGGVLGRTDNVFLNKLSNEALSSVSISESIAQARTSAESSWFTDSSLYAGFNEIKKLVRQNKYLGGGSAESIYSGLVEQFSPDRIEPVRLYYMSALASAGFEAINQELLLNIGVTLTTKFYERRWAYLNKAYHLQRKPDEVYLLENHRKLVEAIYLNKLSGEIIYTQGMLDSLAGMRSQFSTTAAYFFWMKELRVNPWDANKIVIDSLHTYQEWYNVNMMLVDSTYFFAPNWPKVIGYRMESLKVQDYGPLFGEKLLSLVKSDTLNAEYWYLLSLYYRNHKPYDIEGSFKCLLKSCSLKPSAIMVDELFGFLRTEYGDPEDFSNLKDLYPNLHLYLVGPVLDPSDWLDAEALKNFYDINLGNLEWLHLREIVQQIQRVNITDEVKDLRTEGVFSSFIDLAIKNNRYNEITEIISSSENLQELGYQSIRALSMLCYAHKDFAAIRKNVDSTLLEFISNGWEPAWSFFSNYQAKLICHRIHELLRYPGFHHLVDEQVDSLSLLLSELSYPELYEESLLWTSWLCLKNNIGSCSNDFQDDILSLCHLKPTLDNFFLYWNLINKFDMKNRIIELNSDSLFLNLSGEESLLMPHKTLINTIKAKFFNVLGDSVSYVGLIVKLRDDNISLSEIYWTFNSFNDCDFKIDFEALLGDNFFSFISFVNTEQHQKAGLLFDRLFGDFKLVSFGHHEFDFYVAAIRHFNYRKEYNKSAVLFERLIDYSKVCGCRVGLKYKTELGPYDAFIQSKEYKAMMARVYTAPEK